MTDTVLGRLAEIRTMNIGALKGMWRDLNASAASALLAAWISYPSHCS